MYHCHCRCRCNGIHLPSLDWNLFERIFWSLFDTYVNKYIFHWKSEHRFILQQIFLISSLIKHILFFEIVHINIGLLVLLDNDQCLFFNKWLNCRSFHSYLILIHGCKGTFTEIKNVIYVYRKMHPITNNNLIQNKYYFNLVT